MTIHYTCDTMNNFIASNTRGRLKMQDPTLTDQVAGLDNEDGPIVRSVNFSAPNTSKSDAAHRQYTSQGSFRRLWYGMV